MINFSMDFGFSPQEMRKITRDIKRGLLFDLKSKFLLVIPHLEEVLPAEINRRLKSSDVIYELKNGMLRYDLGITSEEAEAVADKIPDIIAKAIQVKVTLDNDSVSLIVEMIKDTYEDILNIPEAHFVQTFTQSNPVTIDWLEWLLTKGDNIIIGDFRVKYTPGNANSRSGGAIMIKKGSFRIPPQFAGTTEDNFITRALAGIDQFIYEQIERFVKM